MRVFKLSKELELLFGSLGAFQSLFLSLYLFLGKKKSVPNLMLASFFFLITLRIVKSLLWVYLDSVPLWFINLGFIAHMASGQLLLLYFWHSLFPRPWNRLNYLHFLPAFLLLPFLFRVDESNFWYQGGYAFLLYHQLAYTLASLMILTYAYVNSIFPSDKPWMWLGILMIGATGIQMAYFSNYILGITPYLAGPLIYGIFICIIAFYGFTHQEVFDTGMPNNKYRNIQLEPADFDDAQKRILQIMESEKPFLDDTFTLAKLAQFISLPPYLTSHIINKGFSTNFSDFVNTYRIQVAKSKLVSKAYRNMKISQVAYDCGFNSISAFNTAFKKNTGTTPSSFKKRQLSS